MKKIMNLFTEPFDKTISGAIEISKNLIYLFKYNENFKKIEEIKTIKLSENIIVNGEVIYENEFLEIIKLYSKELNLLKKNITLILPDSAFHFLTFEIFKLPDDEKKELINSEIEDRIEGFESQDFITKVFITSQTSKKEEILTVSINKTIINKYKKMFLKANIFIEKLTISMDLFLKVIVFLKQKNKMSKMKPIIAVDVGKYDTKILIEKNNEIKFYRSLEIGTEMIVEKISEKFNVEMEMARKLKNEIDISLNFNENIQHFEQLQSIKDYKTDLISQLKMIIDYYNQNNIDSQINNLFLIGETKNQLGFEKLLKEMFGNINITYLDMHRYFESSDLNKDNKFDLTSGLLI